MLKTEREFKIERWSGGTFKGCDERNTLDGAM